MDTEMLLDAQHLLSIWGNKKSRNIFKVKLEKKYLENYHIFAEIFKSIQN